MLQWDNHMTKKLSFSLKQKIKNMFNFEDISGACHSYKFADVEKYKKARQYTLQKYKDMRSKLFGFCGHQQNNAK